MFNFKKLVVFEESIRIGRYLFCVVKASRSGNIKSDRMKRCSVAQNGSDDSLPPLNSLMDREQTREEGWKREWRRTTRRKNIFVARVRPTVIPRCIESQRNAIQTGIWLPPADICSTLSVSTYFLVWQKIRSDLKWVTLTGGRGRTCTTKGRVGSSSCYQIQESFPPIITSFVFIERNIRNERF